DYENIKLLSAEKKLYIVQNKNKYGVVNTKGQVIIPTEYDQIGFMPPSRSASSRITTMAVVMRTASTLSAIWVFLVLSTLPQ
ncbi:MAG: WG repeat-containing protein, partial [Clostridia bacterium]|nr:WG repeat-containing protein [Clostridia bacterium]